MIDNEDGTWHETSKGERFYIPATGWQRRIYDALATTRPKTANRND